MSDPKAPRRPPLMDALGKLCTDGKQLADYLWQVPSDAGVRQQILGILEQIAAESAKQGRREMPRICEEQDGGEVESQPPTGGPPCEWVRPTGRPVAGREVGPVVT